MHSGRPQWYMDAREHMPYALALDIYAPLMDASVLTSKRQDATVSASRVTS